MGSTGIPNIPGLIAGGIPEIANSGIPGSLTDGIPGSLTDSVQISKPSFTSTETDADPLVSQIISCSGTDGKTGEQTNTQTDRLSLILIKITQHFYSTLLSYITWF